MSGVQFLAKDLWMWTPNQGHCSRHRTHPGDYQLCSRCWVQDLVRQNRLESPPRDIQESQSSVGPTRGGCICILSIQSAPAILQLATRLISRSNRCHQSALGSTKRICESTIVPSRQSSLPGDAPTSTNTSCGSSVEGTAMVSSSVWNAFRLPKAASTQPRCVSRVTHQGSDGGPSLIGRVAYLLQKFGNANLSKS